MEKLSRRKFIGSSALATAAAMVYPTTISTATARPAELKFSQIPLPYPSNALEPHIDAMTMDIHYGKHHAAYVKNVNDAIADEKISQSTEKEFFASASKLSAKARNNGGGVWNHNFFWLSMTPASKPAAGKVAEAVNGAFGSMDKFKEQFTQAAMARFGSGWAWLIKDASGKLAITSTPNQDNPLMDVAEVKGTPILGLDVWEHAYYLNYQNRRPDYCAAFWNVVNWSEVAKRFATK